MPGTLYIVATPIGNLSDMTPRGVQVLTDVDIIAAEDTRHSRVLLSKFDIRTPSFSCHKFNEEKRGDFFVQALTDGKDVALISDAGTPCISDPGHRLVKLAAEAGIEIVPVCGANAAAAALSISGFDASNFTFLGFLPRTRKEQAELFDRFASHNHPIVFYESPLRITKTLAWLGETYPNADICLCNDLTKKYEKTYRGSPETVLEELSQNPSAQKGEYTCVVSLNTDTTTEDPTETETLSLEAQLIDIIIRENCTLKEAATILHQKPHEMRFSGLGTSPQRGVGQRPTVSPSKKSIYAASLRLKELFT